MLKVKLPLCAISHKISPHSEKKINKKCIVTDCGNVEQEQENHSKGVVNAGQKSANNIFRNWVHYFHAKLKENRSGGIGQRASQNCRDVKLSCKRKKSHYPLATGQLLKRLGCGIIMEAVLSYVDQMG